jgi:tetratricopeptide (TPR) repeat protein
MKRNPLVLLFVLSSLLSFSQANLNKALDLLLKENKRAQAATMLTDVANSPADGPTALLTLAMIEAGNEHYDQSFNYLQRFLAKSDNPYPYIYAFWTSGAFNAKNPGKNMLKYIEELVKDTKAPSTVKAMAAGNLASAAFNKNDIKECKQLYDTYGEITNWSTVGVFENVSGSGFNKDYGVLAHPQKDYAFKNNKGAEVKWFNLSHNLGHWYDFEYHYDIGNALIYAQSFVTSTAAQQLVMKVGVSGSFKIWVNDHLVASENEERNTNLDVYNFVVNLKSGSNRVLVQLGSAEISNSNFMIRFTDLNDQLVTNLTSQADYVPYTKETGYDVKKLPFFAEEYFEQRLAKNPDSFIDLMMLISVYNQNDKKYEARKIAQKLKKTYPQSTLVAEKVTESYSRDNNNTDLTRELESIKTNDPESLYALILLFDDAMNKEDYKEAWQLLDKREKLFGTSKAIINGRIRIHAQKKEYEELLKLLDKAYKSYPEDDGFTRMQYLITFNTTKDAKKSASILKSYLDDYFDEDIYNLLASSYMENGKKDEAFKMYRKYVEYFPYATSKYLSISDEYFDMQDYNSSLEWIDKVLERAPYIGRYHYKKGRILEAQGKKTVAMGHMQTAIKYNPGNFDARRKIRELQGKKDLFESFAKNDIDQIIKAAPQASEYPNDNSIYLLEDMQQVVYPENGASEEKYELLIKVLNNAGIDRWKEISLPYNYYTEKLIIEKAELFKKDGTKVQSETNDNEVVFSSLEVGDILHILYRKEVVYYGKLAEHFWEEFTFNGGLPVKEGRYSLIVPKDKKFTYRMYNSDLQPKMSDIDDYKLYVWERKTIPTIKPEPYMPSYTDINERVVVTSIPDWNYVANWYRDVSSVKTKADFEVKEKVKELMAGKQNLSDLQKAKLIYDFIEENFSYSDIPFLHSALTPQRASRTLQTKLGDCKDLSTLFVAMCQEAGLNANLVLVDTRDNGDKNLDLPTIGFNHCIAQLKADNKSYLVELTNKNLPFSSMGTELVNANGLYIPKENETATTASLIKLNTPNRPLNTIDRNTTVTFTGSNIAIDRKSRRSGSEASSIREGYKDKGDEDNRKDLSEALSNEFNKKVTLKDLKITNLDNLSDTLVFQNSFVVENFSSELVGMQVFKLPWSDTYNSLDFISLDKRTFPFSFWKFSTTPYDKEVMTLILPAGKKLAEAPVNVSFACSALSYSLSFQVKPDRIIATREVKYLKDQMEPSEYAAFKEFITKMNGADSKQYAFK